METSTLFTTGTSGTRIARVANMDFNLRAAGCIKLQCEGALTGSNLANRAPASFARINARRTADLSPAITICPGELKFAGVNISLSTTDCLQMEDTLASSRPTIAASAP